MFMKRLLVSLLLFAGVTAFYLEPPRALMVAEALTPETSSDTLESFSVDPVLPNTNEVFDLVNTERKKQGLPSLERSQLLTDVAKARAADMQKNGYYAHQAPDGTYYFDLLKGTDYAESYSCENLNLRFSTGPQGYVNGWLDSQSHKRCLLHSDTTRAGYAVVRLSPFEGSEDLPSYVVVAIHATE